MGLNHRHKSQGQSLTPNTRVVANEVIGGDFVVFMRNNLTNKLFVGIQRAIKTSAITTSNVSYLVAPCQ